MEAAIGWETLILGGKYSIAAVLIDLETGKGERNVASACDHTAREEMKK